MITEAQPGDADDNGSEGMKTVARREKQQKQNSNNNNDNN